jgi:hypothetical protein
MKTVEFISQAIATSGAIILLFHVGIVYEMFRVGVIGIAIALVLASIAWGFYLVASSLFEQSGTDELNVMQAVLSASPAMILVIALFILGGLSVITAL